MTGDSYGRSPEHWRKALLGDRSSELGAVSGLLNDCAVYTGIKWLRVPRRDPILSGAQAVLDREADMIWLDESIAQPSAYLILAHEYAHIALHASGNHRLEQADGQDVENELDGYSRVQYAERCADRWAAEFVLPVDLLIRGYHENRLQIPDIAQQTGLASSFVRRRLLGALLNAELEPITKPNTKIFLHPDQQAAAECDCAGVLFFGGVAAGKTTALVARCHKVIVEQGCDPSDIVILTRFKSGAREVHSQLRKAFGLDYSEFAVPRVCTLDSIAYELVCRFETRTELRPGWKPGDAELEFDQVIEAAIHLLNGNKNIRDEFAKTYRHILIDSLEQFTDVRLRLIERIISSSEVSHWATIEPEIVSVTSYKSNFKAINLYKLAPSFSASKCFTTTAQSETTRLLAFLNSVWTRAYKPLTPLFNLELILTEDDLSTNDSICNLIHSVRNSGSGSESIGVLCFSQSQAKSIHHFLHAAAIVDYEYRWVDSEKVKDLICVLGFVSGHGVATQSPIRRRLLSLFGNDANVEEIVRPLRSLLRPSEALECFLTGPSYFIDSTVSKAELLAISELVATVKRIEVDVSTAVLTPDQPGGGFGADELLFKLVLDRLMELPGKEPGIDLVLPLTFAPECNVIVTTISRAQNHRFDHVMVPGIDQLDRMDKLGGSGKLGLLTDAARCSRGNLVFISLVGSRQQKSPTTARLADLIPDVGKVSNYSRTKIIAHKFEPGMEAITRDQKPCHKSVDLDNYLDCPRRYFYDSLTHSPVQHDDSDLIELNNCLVVGVMAQNSISKSAEGSDSKLTKWFSGIFRSEQSHAALAPGQSLRYTLAADAIAKGSFPPVPKSIKMCDSCIHRWVCPT